MRELIHRLRRGNEGVTALEFALILPLLLIMLFGIIEYSLIMFSYSALESAVLQGSRVGKTGFWDPSLGTDGGSGGGNGTGGGTGVADTQGGGPRGGGLTGNTGGGIGANQGDTGQGDGGGNTVESRAEYIREVVRQKLGGLINADSLVIESRVSPGFPQANGGQGNPEGDFGGGTEVVEYTLRYDWNVITPFLDLFSMVGTSGTNTDPNDGVVPIVVTAVVLNEAF